MDIVLELKSVITTLATAMALGAGLGVALAVLVGLPNDTVSRWGYRGTALGFLGGLLDVVVEMVARLMF
jgi:hypothetical protein